MLKFEKGEAVIGRYGTVRGRVCGPPTPCDLEGCTGVRVPVRWQDGKLTWPCSKGLTVVEDPEDPSKEVWKIT